VSNKSDNRINALPYLTFLVNEKETTVTEEALLMLNESCNLIYFLPSRVIARTRRKDTDRSLLINFSVF